MMAATQLTFPMLYTRPKKIFRTPASWIASRWGVPYVEFVKTLLEKKPNENGELVDHFSSDDERITYSRKRLPLTDDSGKSAAIKVWFDGDNIEIIGSPNIKDKALAMVYLIAESLD